MSMQNREELTTVERAVAKGVADGFLQAEPPKDHSPHGCLLSLIALIGIFVLPAVGARFGIEGVGATILGAVLLVTLILGVIIHFLGGGFVRGRTIGAAEGAIEGLERWDGDREAAIGHAVVLLMNATVEYGPTSSVAFDAREVAGRISPVLPLVTAVEELLVREDYCHPVFTILDFPEAKAD